jgi:hypothetical protein
MSFVVSHVECHGSSLPYAKYTELGACAVLQLPGTERGVKQQTYSITNRVLLTWFVY